MRLHTLELKLRSQYFGFLTTLTEEIEDKEVHIIVTSEIDSKTDVVVLVPLLTIDDTTTSILAQL
jgi:hypothetical protein